MERDQSYSSPIYNTKLGRKVIYTSEEYITAENIIKVLDEAKTVHNQNVTDIKYLLKYEKGDQPLNRVKKVRPDIDICDVDNIANQITEFKLGYDWGYPISIVQRGGKQNIDSESTLTMIM